MERCKASFSTCHCQWLTLKCPQRGYNVEAANHRDSEWGGKMGDNGLKVRGFNISQHINLWRLSTRGRENSKPEAAGYSKKAALMMEDSILATDPNMDESPSLPSQHFPRRSRLKCIKKRFLYRVPPAFPSTALHNASVPPLALSKPLSS